MIKESKYIIRRILIGVGIVLVLGFLNGCKVKAYNISNNYASISKSNITTSSNWLELKTYNYVSFYKNISNEHYAFCASYNNTCYEFWSYSSYIANNVGVLIASSSSSSNSTMYYSCAYLSESTLPKITAPGQFFDMSFYSNTSEYCIYTKNSTNTLDISNYIAVDSNNNAMSGVNSGAYNQPSSIYQWYSTIEWNYYGNQYVSDDNIIGVSVPEFVSLHYNKIVNNNVITGAMFSPEFTTFDIDNYKYEYEWNNNGVWIPLTQNNHVLNFNANGDLRFRIVDKSDNSVIDSASFTITNIMQLNDNDVNYDIKFDYKFMTSCDISNTNCNILSGITGGELTINYIPVSNSFYNYYWQFVESGSSLDNNSWHQLASSSNGSRVYETSVNGTMYAKIEDKEGNVLYSSTFTINNIGKDAIVSGSTGNSFFDKINRNINYGGPIASIIRVPITILTTIGGAFSSGSMTCSPYNLGSLWGTNLYLPCVNVKKHLGNSLYMTIDLICSGVMIYYIFKFICLMYDKFMNLDRDPAGNLDDIIGGRD